MTHALVTIIAPLALGHVPAAENGIAQLGNPAREAIRNALDQLDPNGAGTHFCSLHAVKSFDGQRAYIIFEFSADGTEDDALARIVKAIGEDLRPIFALASQWAKDGDFLAYLKAHKVDVGPGWFDNPGLVFAGTPGMTVGRIRKEARLSAEISNHLASQPGDMCALERIDDVRIHLKQAGFDEALTAADAERPYVPPARLGFYIRLGLTIIRTYLWPVLLLVLVWSAALGVVTALPFDGWLKAAAFGVGAIGGLWTGFWFAFFAVVIITGIAYFLFRRAEARDWLEERAADRAINTAMFERENQCAQNHMISVTQRKPGFIRYFTARLVFCVVREFATRFYRPGFLNGIGSIHFARWVTAPKSPDLIFLSNYDSSWESYLEDFITRAHAGLTAIWSNSIGFPRSENLFQRGATDGERFKRYARRSMVPTRFWYSAYPTLTTAVIRINADIRRGLSGAMTDDEAMHWLGLFGSSARPSSKLVGNEIQSLVFGGMGFMPFGACLLFGLPSDTKTARDWLKGIRPHIAFNDGRRLGAEAVVTLALGAGGLARLGLPPHSLATFPFAFLEGMTAPSRSRILGDLGENGSEHWRWGQSQPDAALLIYGRSEEAVAALVDRLKELSRTLSMEAPYHIPLRQIGRKEPFGFSDGISQPVIRGTYKAFRSGDPIHVVEPGEFILGYPDNRGNIPPGPTMPATDDPENHLPLVSDGEALGRTVVENPRDVGFNGSFLVIRELEQDVSAFWTYCESEAERLASADRLPPPYVITRDFIAAKLVGRWPDGSALVRHPYEPPQPESQRYDRGQGAVRKMSQMRKSPSPAKPDTLRPKTTPLRGHPIDPAAEEQTQENDFLFGTEDPEALRCPFGAHVRRANPRESFEPGSADQITISNRHRIIRVGRLYQHKDDEKPGLLFMCLNGDIERQFEFVQQTWLRAPSFHGLACEKDPLLGDAEEGVCSYTIPTREGPVRLSPMPRFITTKGGGYFFLPGKRLIEYLAGSQQG